MRNFLNTVSFTLQNRIKSRFFLVSTILFSALVVGLLNYEGIMSHFSSGEPEKMNATIAINNNSETYMIDEKMFSEALEGNKVEFIKDKKEAEKKLDGSMSNIMVEINDGENGVYDIKISTKKHSDKATVHTLQAVTKEFAKLSTLQNLAVDPAMYGEIMAEPVVTTESYETDAESKMLVTYIIVFIVMIILNFYVQGVASTIVSEKSNRVIEVLLTSSKASELFFGKIVGTCLASLLQMLIIGAVGVITYNLVDFKEITLLGSTLDFSVLTMTELILILVFFVGGYLLYSILAGTLAAFVSNNDDLNQSVLPVTLCFMASTVMAIIYMMNPTLEIIEKLGHIPIFSPMVMIVRVIMTDISTGEIVFSIIALSFTIAIFAAVGSKLYSKGTLNDSKKLSLKALMK